LKGVEELLTAGDLVASIGKNAQQLAIVRTLIETSPPQPHPDVTFFVQGFARHGDRKDCLGVWKFKQSTAYPLA